MLETLAAGALGAYVLKTGLDISKNSAVIGAVTRVKTGVDKVKAAVKEGVAEAQKQQTAEEALLGRMLKSALDKATPEEQTRILATLGATTKTTE